MAESLSRGVAARTEPDRIVKNDHTRLLLASSSFALWLSALLFGVAGPALLLPLLALAVWLVPWRALAAVVEATDADADSGQSESKN